MEVIASWLVLSVMVWWVYHKPPSPARSALFGAWLGSLLGILACLGYAEDESMAAGWSLDTCLAHARIVAPVLATVGTLFGLCKR